MAIVVGARKADHRAERQNDGVQAAWHRVRWFHLRSAPD